MSESVWSCAFQRRAQIFASAVVVATLAFPHPVTAHDEKTPLHFVTEHGVDQGDCSVAERPCATINYALRMAGKGDELRVSAGLYTFRSHDPAEIISLLSPAVAVRGGFSVEDNFSQRDDANRTVLVTSNSRHTQRLRNNGFVVQSEAQLMLVQAQLNTLTQTGLPRYVSEEGKDVGDCSTVDRPCASIAYALARAKSGDTVLVASGTYTVPESAVDDLLREDITVLGGLSQSQGFAPQTEGLLDVQEAAPTYVYGPSYRQRDMLARRSLTLIQDQKGLVIAESIATPRVAAASQLSATRCDPTSGMAGPYPCRNVDFLANIPLSGFSSSPLAANDIWGFVDLNDNREYAIIGLWNGTAIVDVTDPENPFEVSTIGGPAAKWRDIKVAQLLDSTANRWRAYAYVTTDYPKTAERKPTTQGLQIIDLSDLPHSVRLGGTWNGITRAHNVYISNVDYATGVPLPGMEPFVYVAGTNARGGELIGLEISTPTRPTEVLSPSLDKQYIHDGTSIVVDDARTTACMSGNAPAQGHSPCEVFIDFNEDKLIVWDLTDKSAPLILGSTSYFDEQDAKKYYTHSGWWSGDKRFIFLQDEYDEKIGGLNTTMRVFDISDLTAPTLAGVWSGDKRCIDHNSYVSGSRVYMSTYRCGLIVLDITHPTSPQEVGYFDTLPSPSANTADFGGAWGVYPFLPSGSILVSNIEDGLFILRESE